MDSHQLNTVAILPAYNLEKNIGDIVARTRNFVDAVVVVCDGSTDNTYYEAFEAGALCPPHSQTRGKGFAVRKGIEFSKQFNPDMVVLMDADGQHLPEEIPTIITPLILNSADMVVGSRIKGEIKTSKINKAGNFFLKLISFVVTQKWFSDTESGFRGFRSEMLYSLELNSVSYEIESELLLKSLHKKLRIVEVPIHVPSAIQGVTVKDGVKMGWYKIKLGIKLMLSR